MTEVIDDYKLRVSQTGAQQTEAAMKRLNDEVTSGAVKAGESLGLLKNDSEKANSALGNLGDAAQKTKSGMKDLEQQTVKNSAVAGRLRSTVMSLALAYFGPRGLIRAVKYALDEHSKLLGIYDPLQTAMNESEDSVAKLAAAFGGRLAPLAEFAARSITKVSDSVTTLNKLMEPTQIAVMKEMAGGWMNLISAFSDPAKIASLATNAEDFLAYTKAMGQGLTEEALPKPPDLVAIPKGGAGEPAALFEGQSRFSEMIDFFKGGAAGTADLAASVIESAREFASGLNVAIDGVFADAQQARTDDWIAQTQFRLEKDYELQLEAVEKQKKLYEQNMQIMSQAATGTASLMGQTFANMLGGQEEQGKKFLQGILSMLGTLAIARGNVVVADAFAEAYMSGGVSMAALAPGLALIALGTGLKTGAYLVGGGGGGGFAKGGYAGPASGAPGSSGQTSVTINVNSGIVHDEGGLGKTIQDALDRAKLEGRI